VVVVRGLAAFAWDTGDEAGPRLAAVRLRAASQAKVAEAFGVDPVTVWRWDQALTIGAVAGLVPARKGPKRAWKLTPQVATRIGELNGQGETLAEIAAVAGFRCPVSAMRWGGMLPGPPSPWGRKPGRAAARGRRVGPPAADRAKTLAGGDHAWPAGWAAGAGRPGAPRWRAGAGPVGEAFPVPCPVESV